MEKLHDLNGQVVTVVYRGGWLMGTLSRVDQHRWIVTTLKGAHEFWTSNVFTVNTETKVINIL